MKVSRLMRRDAWCCALGGSLVEPARLMWDHDVGFIPIVEPEGGALVGVLTDRDICMAAYTQGRGLHDIPIESVMQREVQVCREEDDLENVQALMREHGLRRLPVVDDARRVIGVISVNDLAREADATLHGGLRETFLRTLAKIGRSRSGLVPVPVEQPGDPVVKVEKTDHLDKAPPPPVTADASI